VRPRKLLRRAKALVPQGHRCVDDVLSVTAHHHEPEAQIRHTHIKGSVSPLRLPK